MEFSPGFGGFSGYQTRTRPTSLKQTQRQKGSTILHLLKQRTTLWGAFDSLRKCSLLRKVVGILVSLRQLDLGCVRMPFGSCVSSRFGSRDTAGERLCYWFCQQPEHTREALSVAKLAPACSDQQKQGCRVSALSQPGCLLVLVSWLYDSLFQDNLDLASVGLTAESLDSFRLAGTGPV